MLTNGAGKDAVRRFVQQLLQTYEGLGQIVVKALRKLASDTNRCGQWLDL